MTPRLHCAAALVVWAVGCQPVPPAAAPKAGRDRATPDAAVAGSAVAAGRAATAPRLPPRTPPRPGTPPAVREKVRSPAPATTVPDAEEAAVEAARELIRERLAGLDPPVEYHPTGNEVRNEFVRRDGRAVVPATPAQREPLEVVDPDLKGRPLVYVEVDVEVTADQVRGLRAADRVGDGLRLFGGLTAVFGATFLFLRLDERTKGYLTRWLAAGAVALALGAAAAMYLV